MRTDYYIIKTEDGFKALDRKNLTFSTRCNFSQDESCCDLHYN